MKEAAALSSRLGFESIDLVGVETAGLPATERVSDGVTIHRLGPSKGSGLAKAVRHAAWCLHVLRFAIARKPGVVNCHSLPTLPIGVLLKIFTGAKLVYDAHELETETAWLGGLPKRVAKILERLCMRWVDLLVVVSPGIERWYRENLGVRNVVTVLNAPNYRDPIERTDRFRQAFAIADNEKILLYQGHLGPQRGIEELVAAAPALRKIGCRVVVMGFGPLEADLRKLADEGVIFLHPAVGQNILLEFTSSADVGVHLIQDTCLNHHLCLPNKLFEYVMARLPVVASGVPEIQQVVDEYSIGACVTKWDPQSVVAAVEVALSLPRNQIAKNLDEAARAYNWEKQEDKMIAAYRERIF